jgi:hypothetical protein
MELLVPLLVLLEVLLPKTDETLLQSVVASQYTEGTTIPAAHNAIIVANATTAELEGPFFNLAALLL